MSDGAIRVLTVSMLYPGSATPGQGVFIESRQRHLPETVAVTVLRLRPWFPLGSLLKPGLRGHAPRCETVRGLAVHDRRFFYLPGIAKHRDGARLGRALLRFLRGGAAGPVDLIDAHFAYPTGYGAVWAGRQAGLPVVVTERGTIGSYAQDARRSRIRAALRGADRVVTVSASLAALAQEIAGADVPVRVIPNGVDASVFSPGGRREARARLGLPPEARILLTVGGLVPRKGVARVLEVLPSIRERHPGVLYAVAGGGGVEGDYERAIRSEIAARELGANVRLAGPVPHAALPDWYRAADVFVLASSNEGWANVLQEALACGTPCVATDVGGNREVVSDPGCGLIVPFGDGAALERAIVDALARCWDREAIADFGRRRDWRTVGSEVAEVYAEVLAARRSRPN